MKNLKKWSALILGLTILAGITFAFSQNTSLQGLFAPPESITEDSVKFNAATVTRSIDEAATKAEEENVKAQSYANEAAADALSAGTAWNNNNLTTLTAAQVKAKNDATRASNAAKNAATYAAQAQAFYDDDYAAWQSSYDSIATAKAAASDSYEAYATAQYNADYTRTRYDYALWMSWTFDHYCSKNSDGSWSCGSTYSGVPEARDAYAAFKACAEADEYNKSSWAAETGKMTSSDCYDDFVVAFEDNLPNTPADLEAEDPSDYPKSSSASDAFDRMDKVMKIFSKTLAEYRSDYSTKKTAASTAESEYNTDLTAYATVFYATADLQDILDEDEPYLDAAYDSANTAAESSAAAQSSKNLADSFEILSCSSLTLNPSSYEMEASDTTAAFELTTHLSTETPATSYWINPKNLMSFVLSELEVTTQITGTISAYPIDTYETQSKWSGDLVFTSDGDGIFKKGSTRSNPLTIAKTDTNDETVVFSGGAVGEKIDVSITDEQTNCSASITITQKTAQRDPGTLHEAGEVDTDADDDGLTADQETTLGTSDTDADSDDDGLTDYEEYITYGTNPLDSDTDDDGLSDYAEINTYGTNPIVSDTDGDGVSDGAEVTAGTDPRVANTKATPVPPEDSDALTPSQLGALESTDTCTDPFEDTYGQWHEPIICLMSEASVVNGRTSTHFVPDDYATRGEAIKMIVRLILGKSSSDAEGLTSNWNDLSGQWFEPYVLVATDSDVVRTRDSFTANELFDGNTSITRGELALFVARAYGLTNYDQEEIFTDVAWSRYDAYAINALSQQKVDLPYDKTDDDVPVVSGYSDGTFRPDNPIARSEAAAMIYRAYLYNHN